MVTITAYGSWFYGFGVLIGPIQDDLGWSTSTLGATFASAQVIAGMGAFVAGRLLDRFGAIGPFVVQAVLGAGPLLAATWADDVFVFAGLYALGGGIMGATGFYHVTTVVAGRLHPEAPAKAIAKLTLIGAFCSPILVPLTAFVVDSSGWRTGARMLALLALFGALIGSSLRCRAVSDRGGPSPRPIHALREALRIPEVRRMFSAYVVGGIALSTVVVYQVPIMTHAGLTLGVAGTLAGFRGLCQVLGRVGLTGALNRWGPRPLLLAAYVLSGVGVLLLLVGEVPAALAFAVLAGAGFGAISPLQAIYSIERFTAGDLGLLMGMQGAVLGLAGGIGPLLGGTIRDATDSWTWVVIAAAAALALAAVQMRSLAAETAG
ncbi:MAG: MFS transporter [Acidimicrobiaceae bacterium]|nr:MFS transporter [Acidimicrobiaceae bacterium]MBT5582356.1 MFS transporter [Acidimicrobiaceae bacterium]